MILQSQNFSPPGPNNPKCSNYRSIEIHTIIHDEKTLDVKKTVWDILQYDILVVQILKSVTFTNIHESIINVNSTTISVTASVMSVTR